LVCAILLYACVHGVKLEISQVRNFALTGFCTLLISAQFAVALIVPCEVHCG